MLTYTVSCQKGQTCDFTSIGAALNAVNSLPEPVTLLIKAGIYHEVLTVSRGNLTLLGEGPDKTVISMNRYANEILEDGLKRGTFRTQTLFIDADNVTLKDLAVENTAGTGSKFGQAIALYADGDMLRFENIRLSGFQDTLFTAPLPPKEVEPGGFRGPKEFAPRRSGRHLYSGCLIEGTVDFIFGGATCLFENCELRSRFDNTRPGDVAGYVTAASTPVFSSYGYVFDKCRFTSEEGVPKASVYLGRPWREYAQTVLIDCELGAHIRPEGWHDWNKPAARENAFYAEYRSTGEGTGTRADFAKQLSSGEAERFIRKEILGF